MTKPSIRDDLYFDAFKLTDPIYAKQEKLNASLELPMTIRKLEYIPFGNCQPKMQDIEPDILRFEQTLPTMTIQPIRDLITGEIISYVDLPITTEIETPTLGPKPTEEINYQAFVSALESGTNLLNTPVTSTEESSEFLEPLPDLPDLGTPTQVTPLRSAEEIPENAHFAAVNDKVDPLKFDEEITQKAYEFNFPLDVFQKRALYHLEHNETVFVSAPTSAGKTVVAQYAIALTRQRRSRAIYTSPIKALSNQKFRDFSKIFGDVGILTGDISLNKDASVLIMTTEILRSMLYRGDDMLRDVECVIFDECHYISNDERGVVWEESIILLPNHINMVFLSATVPNDLEIANWIARTKFRTVYVEKHLERPVPLSHALYANQKVYRIFENHRFNDGNYKKATLSMEYDKRKKVGKGKSIFKPFFWVNVVQTIKKADLLPALIFSFSQKNCEKYAGFITQMKDSLIDEKQINYIKQFCRRAIQRLPEQDRELPQISLMFSLLEKGVGIHHGGILPILKEIVEILLADGFVKVLFCTSTFAMGINVPARCCAFTSLEKFNGKTFENLTPTEYVQMSGRAGRRGLDTVGTTLIVCADEVPPQDYLLQICDGKVEGLQSKFNIRFNMVLNFVRLQGMDMISFLKQSLSSNAMQSKIPQIKKEVEQMIEDLKNIPQISCDIRDIEDMATCGKTLAEINILMKTIINEIGMGTLTESLNPGTVVLTQDLDYLVFLSSERSYVTLQELGKNNSIKKPITDIIAVYPMPFKDISRFGTEKLKWEVEKRIKEGPIPLHQIIKSIQTPAFVNSSIQIHDHVLNIIKSSCITCPMKNEHLKSIKQKLRLENGIAEKSKFIQDDSLALKPILDSYLEMLADLDYISNESVITIKGRVAVEINSCHELIGTELIYNNFFDRLDGPQIAALCSCLVAQRLGKNADAEPVIPGGLEEKYDEMYNIGQLIQDKMEEYSIDFDDEEFIAYNVNPAIMLPVYLWAQGKPFCEVAANSQGVPEGSIIRAITQVNEVLLQFNRAAKIIGNKSLSDLFMDISVSIKRDIIFASSLYFD